MRLNAENPISAVASAEPLREQPHALANHIPALDGIRGLAILLVTIYRFNLRPTDYGLVGRVLFQSLSLGRLGVDLFFVLSGFLITGILIDAKGTAHYFRNFYIRRALRIYPLYYGVLFVAFVAIPVLAGDRHRLFADAAADQASLWLYLANFLIGFRDEWCLGSFNHFWSLCVEEHFYLLWPLVIYFCTRRQAIAACWATIALALLGRVAWLLLSGPTTAIDAFTCFQCDGLALGSLLAILAREPRGIRSWAPWARAGMIVAGLALAYVATLRDRQLLGLAITLRCAFFGGLLVLAVSSQSSSRWGRLWGSRTLRFFGKYSYAMYVFQLPLVEILAPVLDPDALCARVGSALLGRLIYIAAMFAVTTAVSVLSWHLYEKHFLALKSRFQSTGQPALSTAPATAALAAAD